VLDGQLYVVGGMAAYEAPDAPRHVVSGSVMRYNPATNTWQTLKGEQQQQQHPAQMAACVMAVARDTPGFLIYGSTC
jgi:N-acetylneuraminic acid mutarotase